MSRVSSRRQWHCGTGRFRPTSTSTAGTRPSMHRRPDSSCPPRRCHGPRLRLRAARRFRRSASAVPMLTWCSNRPLRARYRDRAAMHPSPPSWSRVRRPRRLASMSATLVDWMEGDGADVPLLMWRTPSTNIARDIAISRRSAHATARRRSRGFGRWRRTSLRPRSSAHATFAADRGRSSFTRAKGSAFVGGYGPPALGRRAGVRRGDPRARAGIPCSDRLFVVGSTGIRRGSIRHRSDRAGTGRHPACVDPTLASLRCRTGCGHGAFGG